MAKYDLVIRGGTIYDGSGSAGFTGDIAIDGQVIFAIGAPDHSKAKRKSMLLVWPLPPDSSTCSVGLSKP